MKSLHNQIAVKTAIKPVSVSDDTPIVGEIIDRKDFGSVELALVVGELETGSPVAASLEIEDLTYTAVEPGTDGEGITIAYVDDGVAAAETVDVTDQAIVVHMDGGSSIASDIKAAIEASEPASLLVSVAVTGTAGDTQLAHTAAPLAGGDDGASFAVVVEHGDDSGLSDAVAVPDAELLGTEGAMALTHLDDGETRKIGYIGIKRYVRMTVTPTENDAASLIGAVAILGHPSQAPLSSQEG